MQQLLCKGLGLVTYDGCQGPTSANCFASGITRLGPVHCNTCDIYIGLGDVFNLRLPMHGIPIPVMKARHREQMLAARATCGISTCRGQGQNGTKPLVHLTVVISDTAAPESPCGPHLSPVNLSTPIPHDKVATFPFASVRNQAPGEVSAAWLAA